MSSPHATVAIISIGQMGAGIASLLHAHSFTVITNVSDRSASTQSRAKSANVTLLPTDAELVEQADYILSIVPPRDAAATALRIATALQKEGCRKTKTNPLWYLELNAVAPDTSKKIAASLRTEKVVYLDGGIIGGPPALRDDKWTRPDIPVSGPQSLADAPVGGAQLAEVLNTRHISDKIGDASGLKCCFAALTKGFTALALQSFSTASQIGVLGPLQDYLGEYNPSAREKAEKSIVGCTSKAGRWVEEMREIGMCFGDGGWGDQAKVFREIAGVFEGLAKVVEKEGTEGMRDVDGVVAGLGRGFKADGGKVGEREDGLTVQELEQDDR